MWEIIKGNAFQVSSLCDNNETLIKCIWAPARAVLSPPHPPPSSPPYPPVDPLGISVRACMWAAAPFPRPPSTRGLITGSAMLKLFSSRSKQTHLREPSNSICVKGIARIAHKSRAIPLYGRYVCTFGLFRLSRAGEIERSARAISVPR